MLEPLESWRLSSTRRKRLHITKTICCHSIPTTIFIVISCFTVLPQGFTQLNDDLYVVKPTPALRLGKDDLTTVLLVKNELDSHGRFKNVRPEVGILTSTARTFIQEGVTTEYATQVVGTTLDNGRVYAQYLKKSSRVLYDSGVVPSVVTSWVGVSSLKSDGLLPQSHNDLFDADQPDWQAIDDRLLGHRHDFVGNTDYVALRDSNALHVLSSLTSKSEDFSKTLSWSSSSSTSTMNDKPLHFMGHFGVLEENARKVAVNKVLPIGDLPTFTIKQHYAPSPYFESQTETENSTDDTGEVFARNPKWICKQHMLSIAKSENEANLAKQKALIPATRHLDTVTYYGFADFTTIVGDSIIVFSPSTASTNANVNTHVTSIKGEATLGADKLQGHGVSTVHTTITKDVMISSTLVEATSLAETEIVTEDPTATNTESSNNNTVESLKENKPFVDVTYLETSEIVVPDITNIEKSSTQTSSVNVIESSVMLSRPSDEDILRIYNALANAEAYKRKIELTTSTTTASTTLEQTVETSNVKILGGATTIFFEDDPFANFVDSAKISIPLTTISASLNTSNTQEKTTKMISMISENFSSTTSSNELTKELPITTEMPIEANEDTETKDREASSLDSTTSNNNTNTTTSNNNTNTTSKTDPSLGSIVIKEIDANDKSLDANCIRTSQVFLTQLTTTLTQSATVVVTNALTSELETEMKQEIQPTFAIGQTTKYYCIQASKTKMEKLETTTASTEQKVSSGKENRETQIISTTVKIDKQKDNYEMDVEETENPLLETTENSMELKTEQPDSLSDSQVDDANVEEEKEDEKWEISKDDGSEAEVEEKENENAEELEDEEIFDNSDDEDDEEIELIYKTLYTTYTYLTTFFHDESTSVSSHTEVVTHVVTSTLGITPTTLQTLATHQLIPNLNENEINPTMIVSSHMESTNRYMVPTGVETFIRSEEEVKHDIEQLTLKSNLQVISESLATFYTTYTYYTTIFAEGETEIMSHTEVITNFKKSTLASVQQIVPTTSLYIMKGLITSSTGESIISKTTSETSVSNDFENVLIEPSHAFDYSTITRATSIIEKKSAEHRPNIPDLGGLSAITLVTDVRTSSSTGNQHIINSFNLKKPNDLKSINDPMQQSILEDQISSESNTDTDEIIPSATLLLQTSFTTFTYYTTMYSGDKTNVISHLETMTNTVTETLQASKTFNLEEASIPITYFTTFTYWTKLAKEGQITTLSREETISNIITPTMVLSEKQKTMATTKEIRTAIESSVINEDVTMSSTMGLVEETALVESIENIQKSNKTIMSSQLVDGIFSTSVLEPTTYYTTYTYYTTSYDTDITITDSRFETVTNIITPIITLTNTMKILEGITTALPSSHSTSSQYQNSTLEDLQKSSLILYDFKKIIDADGISTLYFTTHIKSSVNADGLPTEIISSTSSLHINEEKKTLLMSSTSDTSIGPDDQVQKQYKTGLVRLIEGTRIGSHTTTLYQSKVIGTVIDQRYAQIIESTSSFIFEKTQIHQGDINVNTIISPTSATDIENIQTTQQATMLANSNLSSIEGSIRDQQDQKTSTEPDDGGTDADEGIFKTDEKLRFPFQTKKRPHIPPFRSFPNRSRPQFAPKKNSSATIITRSDFTPTITATPALKTASRFSSTRRGGSIVPNSGNSPALVSSSRRSFGRPNKSFSNAGSQVSSSIGGSSALSSLSRNRFGSSPSSTARPSFASSSKRLGGVATLRPSFSRTALFSTGYPGNSRLSVKQVASLDIGGESSLSSLEYSTTSPSNSQEEDDDSISQDEQNEEENATESTRRQNNPLLRLKRPLNKPQGFTPARPAAQSSFSNNAAGVSPRRNLLTGKAKSSGTITTTTTTTTTQKPRQRTFQRPVTTINNAQNRARPINNLFPPRNIFGAQKTALTTEGTSDKDIIQSEQDGNENDDDSEYDDDDDEESEVEDDDENNRRRRSHGKHSNSSLIFLDKVKAKSRIKREAEPTSQQNRANFRNRFRRPKVISSLQASESKSNDGEVGANESSEAAPVTLLTTPAHRTRSRFGARHAATTTIAAATSAAVTANNHRAIRPTRTTNSNGARAQFTLREKDSSSTTTTTQKGLTVAKRPSFRRPQPAGGPSARRFSISTASSSTTSAGKRRLKSFTSSNDASLSSSYTRNAVTSRNRPSTTSGRSRLGSSKDSGVRGRGRGSHDFNSDHFIADYGGSITITHMIPAEVTIPVINGKVTEYKQVVTAKTSTQVVGPQQYTTIIGLNGQSQLVLTKEDTSVNFNGATEVTQYVLHETPTTTITFTPTTIRGRKTSFSHVLPSTVYSVEQVVSTQQQQISPNAPLANILLSQLLLGNVGLPTNPLFGAIGGALSQPGSTAVGPPQPATPVTEYKTHAFTYVTTLFEGQSTILPITFQGKKILTTIFDTTAQTITATEFTTDTIVTTPTMQALQAQPVVNSLLLQQLLLQQHLQQQQQQIQQQPDSTNPLNAVLNSVPPQLLLEGDSLQELDVSNNIRGSGHGDLINENDDLMSSNAYDLEDISALKQQGEPHKSGRKKSRKNGKNHKRKSHNVEPVLVENSVITLYVSGRRPGEFSTVLSTVHVRPDSTLYKRQAQTFDSYSQHCNSEGSENINDYVAVPEIILFHDNLNITESEKVNIDVNEAATQSLESIVGDVTQWYKTHITTQQMLIMSTTPTRYINVTNLNDVVLKSKMKKNNSTNATAKKTEIEISFSVEKKSDKSNIHPNHQQPQDYSSDEGYLNYLNKNNFFA